MTDHDLPRAFCLVKCFFVSRSQESFRPLACISSCVKVKRLDGVFFAVLEGEKCIVKVFVCDSDGERRWALVRCIGM